VKGIIIRMLRLGTQVGWARQPDWIRVAVVLLEIHINTPPSLILLMESGRIPIVKRENEVRQELPVAVQPSSYLVITIHPCRARLSLLTFNCLRACNLGTWLALNCIG
jgi:hypothetical protein